MRQRSALGLKYIQITPGYAKATYRAGDTIPLKFAGQPVEFDDLFNTFDPKTRQASQQSLIGYGDALAGRGQSINLAIEALNPFLQHLTPVMKNLSDPSTQLSEFFKEIGKASAEVAPVARVQAALFTNMADTFARDRSQPGQPPAGDREGAAHARHGDLELQDPAAVPGRLRRPLAAPAARWPPRCRSTLPTLNGALEAGRRCCRRPWT